MGERRSRGGGAISSSDRKADAPRPAPHELDELIHQRIRLGIMSALAATERMSFSDLRDLLETTDGNLSVHARKLEDAGYIECNKRFVDRVPLTEYRITSRGRSALEDYIRRMEALLDLSRPNR